MPKFVLITREVVIRRRTFQARDQETADAKGAELSQNGACGIVSSVVDRHSETVPLERSEQVLREWEAF